MCMCAPTRVNFGLLSGIITYSTVQIKVSYCIPYILQYPAVLNLWEDVVFLTALNFHGLLPISSMA